ncbi:MAG: adenylate/guanylate cyclase domain-containing protein [Tagaea sp.]
MNSFSQVRNTPPGVLERRRYTRPESARPKAADLVGLLAWAHGKAYAVGSPIKLVDGLMWRLFSLGVPVDRATVSVALLHPQFGGYGIRWYRDTGHSEESLIEHEVRRNDVYRASPFPAVVERGETLYVPIEGTDATPYPVIGDLRAEGYTDYLALPIVLGGGLRVDPQRKFQVCSLATRRKGGFSAADIANVRATLTALEGPLALVTERRIARDLMSIYLGRATGPRVLQGEIARGTGESIRAAILATDMRGFTTLADRLPEAKTIEILNAWFEAQVGAVHAHRGEVLKFVGDGMLAIFPIDDVELARASARDALAAARDALACAARLDFSDAGKLRAVAALHAGEIYYGNIGARDRLDFTAIGPAINVASRLEGVAKSLDVPLVVSDDFAALSSETMRPLGRFPLKGVAEPHEVFAPSVT